MKDIPAMPTGLWMSSLRELPAFRINVLAGNRMATGRSQGDVIKDVPIGDVLRRKMPYADIQVTTLVRGWVINVLRDYDTHFLKLRGDPGGV